jgi:predicted dinucleotide-binding enzyme
MKKIAILDTGTVGQTFAARLAWLGYDAMVGTRNVSEKLSAPRKDGAENAFATWYVSNTKIKLGSFEETA